MRVEFRLLGPLDVLSDDGSPLPLGSPKQRSLLALLLLRADETVGRETAIDAVWGDAPPETAVNALQVYVHGLRKALGPERITQRGTGYGIEIQRGELDLERFDALVAQGRAALAANDASSASRHLADALALWRGEPLADLPQETLADERRRLTELRLHAVEVATDAALALGRNDELIPELEALLSAHPLREGLRAQHMLALYRAGRQADALDAFQSARRALDELGLTPSPALRELERAILRQDPSLRAAGRRPELRLPEPRTPLVGRALDVVAVTARLRDADARLLTLTGPGGVGKTRLAIEAAGELGTHLADGAVFVDLAPVADPAQVAATVAAAVAVAHGDRLSPVEAVVAALRDLDAVLVLDNFERLLAAADVVTAILDDAPGIRILVTSRTPLRVFGEHEYAVQPLETPAEHARFEALARNDSVAVFLARAQAVDRNFRLDERNADDVAAVCRALEGLPLALELAAARVKLLTPAQIRSRLERPLEILAGGSRDLPERHQTLRAAIAWSYELLDEQARRLFAQLSVFAGGCTLDAAEAVCDAELEPLASLLDNALLRRYQPRDAEPRFRMLDAVREYARERLQELGSSSVRARHADYFASLAERAAPAFLGRETPATIARLAREHDNLRAALAYSLEHDPEIGYRLIAATRPYWAAGARGAEAASWLEQAFDGDPAASTPEQLGALIVFGRQLMYSGRYDRARDVLRRAVTDAERLEQWRDAAVAYTYLSWLAANVGDYDENLECGQKAVALAERAGDVWAERQGHAMVAGALINRGEPQAARPHLDHSLALARRLADPGTLQLALVNSAYGAICTDDLERARAELDECVAMCAALDDKSSTVGTLQLVAWHANMTDTPERAAAALRDALPLLRDEGRHAHHVDVITEAAVTLAQTRPSTAARLLGAADAAGKAVGMRRSRPMMARVGALERELESSLGPAALAAAFADGTGLSLDDAREEALRALEPGAAGVGTGSRTVERGSRALE